MVEFFDGARVELREVQGVPSPEVYSGTYSDVGDCRVMTFTHLNEEPLPGTLTLKGLFFSEVVGSMLVGGFWWNGRDSGPRTLPPDDVGSWTATSGGNQGPPKG